MKHNANGTNLLLVVYIIKDFLIEIKKRLIMRFSNSLLGLNLLTYLVWKMSGLRQRCTTMLSTTL